MSGYTPKDGEAIFAEIQDLWGSRLEGLTKVEKWTAIAILSRTIALREFLKSETGYTIVDAIGKWELSLSGGLEKFLLLLAKLPSEELPFWIELILDEEIDQIKSEESQQ